MTCLHVSVCMFFFFVCVCEHVVHCICMCVQSVCVVG